MGDVAPGVGIVAALLMLIGLVTCRAWDPRVLGQGAEEFSRVIRAIVTAAVALGLLGLAIQATAPRPWVFGLMPAAGVLAVAFSLAFAGGFTGGGTMASARCRSGGRRNRLCC